MRSFFFYLAFSDGEFKWVYPISLDEFSLIGGILCCFLAFSRVLINCGEAQKSLQVYFFDVHKSYFAECREAHLPSTTHRAHLAPFEHFCVFVYCYKILSFSEKLQKMPIKIMEKIQRNAEKWMDYTVFGGRYWKCIAFFYNEGRRESN